MDRRHFLRSGSAIAAALATGSLAACASDTESDPASATATDGGGATASASPAATAPGNGGGTVRVGLLSNPADTLDPTSTTGLMEFALLYAVHDSLVDLKGDEFELRLAESIEPDEDGSTWTIVLREGPTFHDGAPVTADDVVYSLQLLAGSPTYGLAFALLDIEGLEAVDERTISVPLVAPRGDFVEAVLSQLSIVVPNGFTDWGGNIGSGPFVLESYEAGVGAVVTANPDYWDGAPALDSVEFVSIADPATKANAISSGEAQYVGSIDATAAATLEGADGVAVLRGSPTESTIRCFVFNRQRPPFDDPSVIEACKLAVDRPQMIDVITLGNATLGNDMPSLGFADYPEDVPQRERDVERATALFAEAGVTEFTMHAADHLGGVVAAAELFVQQLAECGVTVTLDIGDPATYFNDIPAVLSYAAQSFWYINRPPITLLSTNTGSGAAFNVLGSGDGDYDAALAAAQAILDPVERGNAVAGLLEMVHDTEGWLIWGFEQQIDAAVEGLEGVQLVQSLPIFTNASLS